MDTECEDEVPGEGEIHYNALLAQILRMEDESGIPVDYPDEFAVDAHMSGDPEYNHMCRMSERLFGERYKPVEDGCPDCHLFYCECGEYDGPHGLNVGGEP